jgi:hypothetical protein
VSGTVPSPELVGPYLDEIIRRLAEKIHERCVADWRRTTHIREPISGNGCGTLARTAAFGVHGTLTR